MWHAVAAGVAAITEPGDRVAILAENCAEYVECYYAVPRAGRLLVPINQRLHPDEWRGTLQRSGARVLIAEPDVLARLGRDVAHVAGVEVVIELGRDDLAGPDVGALPDVHDADVTWLIGTSGTTGTPKLAMLTHASLMAAVDATLAARPVRADDVFCTPFPLCHVAGYNVLGLHRMGRPVVLMRRFDPARLVELIVEHGVTLLSLAPTMIAMLLDDPRTDDRVLASVRSIGYGASAIPAPVLRAAVDRWDCDLSQGYGMTELSGNAVFLDADAHRRAAAGDGRLLGAAGYPAPGVEVRLQRTAPTRSWCGPTRSWPATGTIPTPARPHSPAAGCTPATSAGSTTTGCSRWWTGRRTSSCPAARTSRPGEVEAVLHSHPGVADVAVIGFPDERWGERVAAVVVRRPGDAVTAQELIALRTRPPRRLQGSAVGRVRRRASPQRRGQGAQATAARRARARDAVSRPALR